MFNLELRMYLNEKIVYLLSVQDFSWNDLESLNALLCERFQEQTPPEGILIIQGRQSPEIVNNIHHFFEVVATHMLGAAHAQVCRAPNVNIPQKIRMSDISH